MDKRSHAPLEASLTPGASFRTNRGRPVLDSTGAQWVELGPRPFYGINGVNCKKDQPMSGQVSAIALDGDEIYIGSSSGGLWRGTSRTQFELGRVYCDRENHAAHHLRGNRCAG